MNDHTLYGICLKNNRKCLRIDTFYFRKMRDSKLERQKLCARN